LVLVVLAPASALGELFRCKGSDGKVVFTDDKSVCPDAKPFEPSGRVSGPTADAAPTRGDPPALRARPAPIVRRDAESVERAEAERWRGKRAAKESELAALADRREELRGFVAICNRRGRVVTFDEAGIKHEVPCKVVQRRFAKLDDEEARIREYLEKGLADECRRAGCLPGWIR
jgi:hypothetical protein